MAKRKSVEPADAPVAADPKPAVRKASRPKSAATSAAHKHHTGVASSEAVIESPVNATETSLSRESISRLAYALWEARGHQDGSADQDWFEAEKQLLKLA